MEIEKMNNSINEMEEIVSKMRNIKDAYSLLEKNANKQINVIEKLEKLENNFEIEMKNYERLLEKVNNSYDEIYKYNESIRKDINTKFIEVKTEICDAKNCNKISLNEVKKVIYELETSVKAMKETMQENIENESKIHRQILLNQDKKINIILVITASISIISIINCII